MKIEIEVEGEELNEDGNFRTPLIISNDAFDTYNFVELIIEEKTYTVNVNEFFKALKLFNELRYS